MDGTAASAVKSGKSKLSAKSGVFCEERARSFRLSGKRSNRSSGTETGLLDD